MGSQRRVWTGARRDVGMRCDRGKEHMLLCDVRGDFERYLRRDPGIRFSGKEDLVVRALYLLLMRGFATETTAWNARWFALFERLNRPWSYILEISNDCGAVMKYRFRTKQIREIWGGIVEKRYSPWEYRQQREKV